MTTQEVQDFINRHMDTKLDTDGFPKDQPYQCVDVIRAYQTEVIKNPLVGGNAIDYWYQYPYSKVLQQYFTRIVNTWWFVPKLGDITIFAGTKTNPYGHIGIVSGAANIFWMTVFEQNDPYNSPCHYKAYNYRTPPCLGFLRPRQLTVASTEPEVKPSA